MLSKSAPEFVVQHPREARLAVAVALETAAAQREADDGGIDAPERLQPFVVCQPDSDETLGVPEAVTRLGVSRTTVHDWVQRGTLLAWKSTKRGLNIPAAQILGPGAVVAGLADVVAVIAVHVRNHATRRALAKYAEEISFSRRVADVKCAGIRRLGADGHHLSSASDGIWRYSGDMATLASVLYVDCNIIGRVSNEHGDRRHGHP